MEVHAHSHTPRKKWSHYFWEFFMLFLAVFCGYLAERKLEHDIEQQREKNFMRTLVIDLRHDIAALDSNEIKRTDREIQLDSLVNLLTQSDLQKNAKEIYRLADATDSYETFIRNDRTIIQLKQAGGMRLIRNESVSEKIMAYDNYITSESEYNNRTEANRIDQYKQKRFRLFDASCFALFSKGGTTCENYFLPADKITLNEIAGAVLQTKLICATNRHTGITVKEKAIALIELIKKEYHLK